MRNSAKVFNIGLLLSAAIDLSDWHVDVVNAGALAATLARERESAFLFRTLATLLTGVPLFDDIGELRWKGPTEELGVLAARFDAAVMHAKRIGVGR